MLMLEAPGLLRKEPSEAFLGHPTLQGMHRTSRLRSTCEVHLCLCPEIGE